MAAQFTLDPRLEGDTHVVGDLPLSRLLLMDDSTFPWLILVPRRADVREITDLGELDALTLWGEVRHVTAAFQALTSADKMNIAALGNHVSQLHVHVIARFEGDATWPAPVWSNAPRARYTAEAAAALIAKMRAALPAAVAVA